MALTGCRYFNGYKPCGKSLRCDESCTSADIPDVQILLIHLGAMGAVVRSTALLAPIKRKYPSSHITWITDAPMDKLLNANPFIDRVALSDYASLLELKAKDYDVAFVVDKSARAVGIEKFLNAKQVFGFTSDLRSGGIIPASAAAEELWGLGLSNEKKFHENQKAETQLVIEALELGPFLRDEYYLPLSLDELVGANFHRQEWRKDVAQPVIGINTGCSPQMPAKKFTVEFHRQIIREMLKQGFHNLVLLGGPEDRVRNQQIAEGLPVFQSATDQGPRRGLQFIEACDVVLTGDSLGLHLAVARKKFVVAWFGPTCPQEIDLYDRGLKILTKAACSPCWKKNCQMDTMCYDQVELKQIMAALQSSREWWRKNCHQSKEIHSSLNRSTL